MAPVTRVPTSARGIGGAPFRLMLGATVLAFSGYALLLPVVPLWVARGGSGAFGAGATTGVLMLATVVTQLGVPWMLARIGHRWVLAIGSVLLGAPAPLLALSPALAPVLGVSVLRGIGFGMLTVAGGALVAELVPRAQHGRAAARYGLAVGLPQLGLLAAGVAVVDQLGFTVVFLAAGVAPVLGALLVPLIGPAGGDGADPLAGPAGAGMLARSAFAPVLAMIACSIAQGGLITFLPLAAPDAGLLVALALLATSAGALLGRLLAGELVDRRGWGARLLAPGMLLTAAGMVAEVIAVTTGGGVLLAVGAGVVGVGFGVVQNASLTALFTAFGSARYGAASAAWNIAYDAGTGVGAVGLGAVAEPFGFAAAFGTSAALLGGTALLARTRRR
ncbi:MFS transporter [Pseudonocardia nigra]|uniref:MFS transporter n=1 Tax=Pseudonocardia nigra TaxID=1921578 RepID=UPI0027E347D6|nr:MFS transporter [Pseudonocardia nigra]